MTMIERRLSEEPIDAKIVLQFKDSPTVADAKAIWHVWRGEVIPEDIKEGVITSAMRNQDHLKLLMQNWDNMGPEGRGRNELRIFSFKLWLIQ